MGSQKLMPSQKQNLMPMPIFTIQHTESGQHGTLDTIWSEREVLKLMLNQKENPMPIFTTPPMDTGHLGTLGTIGSEREALKLMPSQKENLMLMLGCIIPLTDTGHLGIMATTSAREALMPSQK